MPAKTRSPRLRFAAAVKHKGVERKTSRAGTFEVSERELLRFRPFADIRDNAGFARELNDLLSRHRPAQRDSTDELRENMRRRAHAHVADAPWAPAATEFQRGRKIAVDELNAPANLPIARYAQLANRSRQQIYKDIESRRLLAISVGDRGQRVPDWQLDPRKHRLTQAVLHQVGEIVDAWTIFRSLQTPRAALGKRTPLQAADSGRIDEIVDLITAEFGVQA